MLLSLTQQVMISFKMDKQLQTISNYFLFSLAVADFIIGEQLGCGFPVKFEFPPLPGKPSSVCLATEFA